MTNIDEKIKALIEKKLELCPFKEKDIFKVVHDDLMRFELNKNVLVIGRRQNYYDRRYKTGWPLYIQFNYTISDQNEEFIENIVGLMRIFTQLQDERSWAIHRQVQDQRPLFQTIMKHFNITSFTIKSADGSIIADECIINDDKIEYYIALSFIKSRLLEEQLFPYYATLLFGLGQVYDDCIVRSIDPILNDIMSSHSKMRMISKPVEPKKGAQFFGTDLRQMDYSLSAHKDIYAKAQSHAKLIDRYCSINEDPKELIYWLKRYQNRPTFSYWQEALEALNDFSWIE